ncbi:hypothetical protein JCM33374_g4097 [Metschnikowia sp. JCM 33374]|nr:hypothetical protein JCM33374_g4097 [Metschnikowia sp. JCM 33374]
MSSEGVSQLDTLSLVSEREDPPSYSSSPIELQTHEFVIRDSSGKLKAFPSEKSMHIYEFSKRHSHLQRHDPLFIKAKGYQNMSVGLPLLISHRRSRLGSGEYVYSKFFECKPTPNDGDKLYDKGDDRQIGHVLLKEFVGYHRYIIRLKDTEVVVFVHKRLPIADFKIGNERFRFVKAYKEPEGPIPRTPFFYQMYLLAPHQPSLIDNLDSCLRVQTNNPLLGLSARNIFRGSTPQPELDDFVSPYSYGSLEACRHGGRFSRNKKCATVKLNACISGNPHSNKDVEFTSLIFVAVSLVLQHHEMDIQQKRATETSSLTNTSVVRGNLGVASSFAVSNTWVSTDNCGGMGASGSF